MSEKEVCLMCENYSETHERKGGKPMIKGKAKMEFGTGDIRMTGALSGDIGALCCITQEPHKIGERVLVEDTWNVDQAEVILTFTKTESIDALIAELQALKRTLQMVPGDGTKGGGRVPRHVCEATPAVQRRFTHKDFFEGRILWQEERKWLLWPAMEIAWNSWKIWH